MTVSRNEFLELQERIMLLEGGNTPYQAEVSGQLQNINGSVQTLAHNTATSIVSMRQELGLSIDGVEEVLTDNIQVVKSTLNERFDRLLDYLESWISAGSLNMGDIKSVVSAGGSSSGSSSSSSSESSTSTTSTAGIKADIVALKADVQTLTSKMDALLDYFEHWSRCGNVNFADIKQSVETQ